MNLWYLLKWSSCVVVVLICVFIGLSSGSYWYRRLFYKPAGDRVAILVLGGSFERIKAVPELARRYPRAEIIISEYEWFRDAVKQSLEQAGLPFDRVIYDSSAVDTVSNFTTVEHLIRALNIGHVVILTHDFHMPRALAIGRIVLGSIGVELSSSVVSSERPKESYLRVWRDQIRSYVWLFSGLQLRSISVVSAQKLRKFKRML